jgi:hypothetical protein
MAILIKESQQKVLFSIIFDQILSYFHLNITNGNLIGSKYQLIGCSARRRVDMKEENDYLFILMK